MVINLSEELIQIKTLCELSKIQIDTPESIYTVNKKIKDLKGEIIKDLDLIIDSGTFLDEIIQKIKTNDIGIFQISGKEETEYSDEKKKQIVYAIMKANNHEECTKILQVFGFYFTFTELISKNRSLGKLFTAINGLLGKVSEIKNDKNSDKLTNTIFEELKDFLINN